MTDRTPTVDQQGVVDRDGLRRAFGRFPSGVTAVCALDDDTIPLGTAASSVVETSLTPPPIGLCVQRTSTTWPRRSVALEVTVAAEYGQLCITRHMVCVTVSPTRSASRRC